MARWGLGRDDFMRLMFSDDFFDQNPNLAAHKDDILACREAYRQSAAKSSCRCGGDPRHFFDCMDRLLETLLAFKETNPAAVQEFIAYAGRKRNQDLTSITLYYRKTAELGLKKHIFP